jgi:threonine/homoserine/homoserine lactone efflux protein
MSDAFQIFLSGAALGVSIAAPPGPVTAMAAQQVASRSWLSGWLVLLGATVADAIFFALTFYGVTTFVSPALRSFLFVVGGALMLYLAVSTVGNARQLKAGAMLSRPTRWAASRRSPFLLGLSIGLTNPFQLGWWIAIGAGMVAEYGSSIAVGFFAGILLWTVIFSALVHAGVARYERLAPVIAFASAAVMAGFGLWFLALGLLTTTL